MPAAAAIDRRPVAVSDATQSRRSTATVVLTWNQREATLRCLRSIQSSGYPLANVVLWDNGSNDGTGDAVANEFPLVVFHYHRENIGVASGRNAGASLAVKVLSPSHVLFLDNDMVVAPGFFEALLTPFNERSNVGQTHAKIRLLDDPRRLYSAGGLYVNYSRGTRGTVGHGDIDVGQFDAMKPCLPSGGATLVAVEVFRKLGGFDSLFDPYGPEDLDFSQRVRNAGFESLYVPSAVAYHDWQPKYDRYNLQRSDFAEILHRWLVLISRHATRRELLVFCFWGAPTMLIRVVTREIRRRNFAVLRGVTDGITRFAVYLFQRKPRVAPAYQAGIEAD